MDRVWLGIVAGAAIFLLWWAVAGTMVIGILLGVLVFVAALMGVFHEEWTKR